MEGGLWGMFSHIHGYLKIWIGDPQIRPPPNTVIQHNMVWITVQGFGLLQSKEFCSAHCSIDPGSRVCFIPCWRNALCWMRKIEVNECTFLSIEMNGESSARAVTCEPKPQKNNVAYLFLKVHLELVLHIINFLASNHGAQFHWHVDTRKNKFNFWNYISNLIFS